MHEYSYVLKGKIMEEKLCKDDEYYKWKKHSI